jgi:hypothetical protein
VTEGCCTRRRDGPGVLAATGGVAESPLTRRRGMGRGDRAEWVTPSRAVVPAELGEAGATEEEAVVAVAERRVMRTPERSQE